MADGHRQPRARRLPSRSGDPRVRASSPGSTGNCAAGRRAGSPDRARTTRPRSRAGSALEVWHAGDRLQETQELFAARWPAQDVEAVADLGSCQLAQIGVELPDDVSDLVSLHGRQSKRRAVRRGPFVPFVRMPVPAQSSPASGRRRDGRRGSAPRSAAAGSAASRGPAVRPDSTRRPIGSARPAGRKHRPSSSGGRGGRSPRREPGAWPARPRRDR